MDISDDIKTDVKKTLFTMVENVNKNNMPRKIVYDQTVSIERVEPSEYLQVLLLFLEECHREE